LNRHGRSSAKFFGKLPDASRDDDLPEASEIIFIPAGFSEARGSP
jgi:hypothetical protein